jgi:hypothetical protein
MLPTLIADSFPMDAKSQNHVRQLTADRQPTTYANFFLSQKWVTPKVC